MTATNEWAEAEAASRKIGRPRQRSFEDWLALARALAAARAHVLAKTGLESDASPIFRAAFAKFVAENPWIKPFAGQSKESLRSAAYFVAKNEAAIEAWRATLSESDRARIRHPEVVRREFLRAHRPPATKLTQAELKRENEALRGELRRLKTALAMAEAKLAKAARDEG